jgi:hypothetical protein
VGGDVGPIAADSGRVGTNADHEATQFSWLLVAPARWAETKCVRVVTSTDHDLEEMRMCKMFVCHTMACHANRATDRCFERSVRLFVSTQDCGFNEKYPVACRRRGIHV